MTPLPPESGHAAPRSASAWNTVKTIAWSFFGVRRRKDHDQEGAHINPIQVVIAGFIGVIVLVVGLMVLVSWIAA